MMCSGKDDLLKQVYETGFAVDDAVLFLDTHPTDIHAMRYYSQAQAANKQAVQAYEEAYGPLTAERVTSEQWDWIKDPWPWEGGNR